jgi:DNA-binding NarL/FixJ family response regulator
MERGSERATKDNCPLTPAQLRVLQAAHDYDTIGAKEIAGHIERKRDTVRTHFENALERPRDSHWPYAHHRTHAVAIALKEGWIEEDRDRPGRQI